MSALDKPYSRLVAVPLEVYLGHMAQVSVVEAFLEDKPPSVVGSSMIYNSPVDQMVLLPNQIKRLVHLQLVGFENVDHVQRVVSSPLLCVL